jgi:hypothetical protein
VRREKRGSVIERKREDKEEGERNRGQGEERKREGNRIERGGESG